MTPLIVLIDIDGTLIGDISTQVLEWEIISQIDKRKLKQYKSNVQVYLSNGLIRPHFSDFINSIKSRYSHVEFFVYTASDDKWANFLVPCIEKTLNISINRPIFSRKHCILQSGVLCKSFARVAPFITTRLKKVYTGLQQKTVLKNMFIVDNNNVLIDNRKYCIQCKTYEWSDVYDVLKLVNVGEDNFIKLGNILNRYGIIETIGTRYESLLSQYYSYLAKQYKTIPHIRKQDEDTFWLDITAATINALRKGLDRDQIVKYIVQKLS
jgi:hypothetical protein